MKPIKNQPERVLNSDGTPSTVITKKTGYTEQLEKLTTSKGDRATELDSSVITVNGVIYDSDEKSMDRMNRIVSLGNMEFNYRVSVGEIVADAYSNTYKLQTIPWVGADNVVHNVMIESIAEALRQGMTQMGTIWGKY